MTRAELIEYVQTKLEEKSPFDEPTSFIAAAGDSSYDKVKPIKGYIDDLLNEAANDCLRMLPLSLVGKDVTKLSLPSVTVNADEVGEIELSKNSITHYIRPTRMRVASWKRDVTAFITSSDPLYLLQQDEHTRGKLYKPVVALVPERDCIELFSFPGMANTTVKTGPAELYYIHCNKTAGSDSTNPVFSPIDELIGIRCAELVCDVFSNEGYKFFQKEFSERVKSVLQ